MDKKQIKELSKEVLTILVASIILGLVVAFPSSSLIIYSVISFLIIIALNITAKKILAYYFEADIKTKFWTLYQFWFTKRAHFKKPVPMLWLPLVLSFISRGMIWWLGILEFDVKAKTERVSRRHGLYRFSEITEWHIALIATIGIAVNLTLAIIGYISGFETFAKLNIYFATWSIIPLSSLDGSKIFFGSKPLWFTMLTIIAIFLGYSLMVV